MTYKSRIETNNTELQSILETVNALPGSRPLCTVTINNTYGVEMCYINENNEYVTVLCSSNSVTTVEIPNQSIIVMSKGASSAAGDIARVAGNNAGDNTAYRIYGDCTLEYYGAPEAS